MYPIYSMDIALPVMKSRWEDASGKVPECMVDLTTWYCTIAVLWIPPPVNKCSN